MGRTRTIYIKKDKLAMWEASRRMAKTMGISHSELIERCLTAYVKVRTNCISPRTKIGEVHIVDGMKITVIE